MPISGGTKLGVYEIIAPLGAGGMGEVYRARDTKLGRSVAIKVLPDALAQDQDRIARFEREAKALASLNHPHIATLHGLDEVGGRHLLIMELVEGETLAERIARAPLSIDETLLVARQIAEALEAAHEKGIIHRDLKPANIKLTPDDQVKVLDFGLAKAMESAPEQAGFTNSPTLSVLATGAGVILGTAAYMSPEQAKGHAADHRSDVFSFGCVLYEMLTRQQPFAGDSIADILASVLAREPDWNALPANLDPRVTRLLKRCVQKQRKHRWQAIGDVRLELETITSEPYVAPTTSATTIVALRLPLWRRAWPLVATAVIVAAGSAFAAWSLWPRATAPVRAHFVIPLAANQNFNNINRSTVAIAHDGSRIAYAMADKLYLRSLSDPQPHPIGENDGLLSVLNPVFSPDGNSIAIWVGSDSSIKRFSFDGGLTTLCSAGAPLGMSWSGETITFADERGIYQVSASGGEARQVVTLGGSERSFAPSVLPDGDQILFTLNTVNTPWDDAQIVVQSLKTGVRRVIVNGGSAGAYSPLGYLVYGKGGRVLAAPFDAATATLTGAAVPLLEGVRRSGITGVVHFAVADGGTLAFIPGRVTDIVAEQFAFFDGTTAPPRPLNIPLGSYAHPRFSPDGTHLAYHNDDGRTADVWVYDISNKTALRRLTFGGRNRLPVWSPDGQSIVFASDRDGGGLFRLRADGSGNPERLTTPGSGVQHLPYSFDRTGSRLMIDIVRADRFQLAALVLADKRIEPMPQAPTSVPSDAQLSPDGKWLAYTGQTPTGPTLKTEAVFVEPFPPTGAKYQISTDSEDGHHAVWTSNGTELLYTPGPGPRLSVVTMRASPAPSFSQPKPLARLFTNGPPSSPRPYDAARDGHSIVALADPSDPASGGAMPLQIDVVLNWLDRRRR